MLAFDHVKVIRRRAEVHIDPLWGLARAQAEDLLGRLSAIAVAHDGRALGELREALDDVVVEPRQQRALRAAQKLVLDHCDFAARDDVDPPALRAALFQRAAALRARGQDVSSDVRDAVVAAVAAEHGLSADELSDSLYADLDQARLVDAHDLRAQDPAALVDAWAQAEVQAVLQKAQRLTIDVIAEPAGVRALLAALKLRQLLFEVEPSAEPGAVRLVVDGPAALFSQGVRYGQKLAQIVPCVVACASYRLAAELVLKKGAPPTRFVTGGRSARGGEASAAVEVSPLVAGLLLGLPQELLALPTSHALHGATAALANDVIQVKGAGACVPDIAVTTAAGRTIYVEVLGFWSRDAVWRRIALVEAGLQAPVVWCVSERLRVSEDALPSTHSALLTFKGALSAKKVVERLTAVAAGPA